MGIGAFWLAMVQWSLEARNHNRMTGVCSLFLSGNSWVSRYGGMVWLLIAGKIHETHHQTGWAISHGHVWLLQGNHELPQFAKEHLGMSRCSVYVADHRWNPHFLRPFWGRLWVWMGPGTKAVGGCTNLCCHVLVPIYRSLQIAQI